MDEKSRDQVGTGQSFIEKLDTLKATLFAHFLQLHLVVLSLLLSVVPGFFDVCLGVSEWAIR